MDADDYFKNKRERSHETIGKREYRTHKVPDKEQRTKVFHVRMSQLELDDLYMFAKSHRTSMSYLVRKALEDAYPEIFVNMNRHIRKPRKKAKPIPPRTTVLKSFDGQTITVIDNLPDDSIE